MVYIPLYKGFWYLIIVRCDLLNWVEAKPLCTLFSKVIAEFLWENVICWHRCFGKLVIDKRSENKDVVVELTQKYKIKKVVVLIYYPQANNIIEKGYMFIVDPLSKISAEDSTNWMQNLPAMLRIDWLTIRISTSLTLYYLNCGNNPTFPIKLELPTWKILH